MSLIFSLNTLARTQVVMETNFGNIEIELYDKKSPKTVENFLKYTDSKFYDGTIFHRVIDNFMIQGGGFTPSLERKKTLDPIVNEASNKIGNETGTIAMARTPNPNSATSQFFINVRNNSNLNYAGPGQEGYAVFGRVIKGMSVVNRIKKVRTMSNGNMRNLPSENVVIKKVYRKAKKS